VDKEGKSAKQSHDLLGDLGEIKGARRHDLIGRPWSSCAHCLADPEKLGDAVREAANKHIPAVPVNLLALLLHCVRRHIFQQRHRAHQ